METRETPVRILEIPARIRTLPVRLAYWMLFLLVSTIVIVGALLILPPVPTDLFRLLFFLACGFAASLIIGLLPLIQRRRGVRRLREWMNGREIEDGEGWVRHVYQSRRWLEGTAGALEALRLLVRSGHVGIVVRFSGNLPARQDRPIDVSFEARSLDETEPTFRELWNATSDPESSEPELPANSPAARLWRNIILKEGRFSTFLYLAFFALNVHRCWQAGRISVWLVFWAVMVGATLFSPATGGMASPQWFLMPGGCFVRLPRRGEEIVNYPFYRRDSNVAIVQHSRHRWKIMVVDGQVDFETVATSRETRLFLRAWFSAASAPTPEELVHLA